MAYFIVPEEVIPHCCLLGMDFIMGRRLTLDCARGLCITGSTLHSAVKLLPVAEEVVVTVSASSAAASMVEGEDLSTVEETITSLLDIESVKSMQASNLYLSELLELISAGIQKEEWLNHVKQYTYVGHKLSVREGILLFEDGPLRAVVVSLDLLVDVAIAAHYHMLHIGRDKLIHLIKRHVWHPKLYSVCQDVCVSCSHCQMMKVARQCYVPPTIKVVTRSPFELLAVDLVTFPKSKEGWIGCCVAIDHNSKWLAAMPIKNKTTTTVCNVLEHSIFPFVPRLPERLLSDNGKEFSSADFQEMLQRYSIKHVYTTPYKPSSNGCVERVNRTLGELLRSAESLKGSWRENLTRAILTYNNTRHRELNMSPAEYLLNQKHSVRDAVLVSEGDTAFWRSGHPKFVSFAVGQHVLKKVPRHGHLASSKFMPRYEGPFEVLLVNDNGVTYELNNVETKTRIKAHHTQLIPWTAPPDYLRDRLKQYEDVSKQEDLGEVHSDVGEPDFSGFSALSTTSNSAVESPDTPSDSDCSVVFAMTNRKKRAESGEDEVDTSMCFVDESEVENESLIFVAGAGSSMNHYRLCNVEEETSQMEGVVAARQNMEPSDIVPEQANIVLTPMEEIWEVSSVEASEVEEFQNDATGGGEEQQLEKLEQYVDGAWDAIFGNESAVNRGRTSYVLPAVNEFDGFITNDYQEVNAKRREVLQKLKEDELQLEAQISSCFASVVDSDSGSSSSVSKEL